MGRISAEEKARVRVSLIRTAAEHFALEGYEGASINRISLGAGFAKGTVYNYFPSKAALLAEVLRAGGDDVRGLANIGPQHSLNDGRCHAAGAEKRIFHGRKASGEQCICKDCREWEAGLLGGLTTEDTERTEGEGD